MHFGLLVLLNRTTANMINFSHYNTTLQFFDWPLIGYHKYNKKN